MWPVPKRYWLEMVSAKTLFVKNDSHKFPIETSNSFINIKTYGNIAKGTTDPRVEFYLPK